MKRKLSFVFCLVLSVCVLSGCGSLRPNAPGAETPAPAAAALPSAEPTALPTPEPTPAPTAAPTPEPTPVPAPTPTPAPTPAPIQAPAPTPTPANLPRVTKSPTDETVLVNGTCQFVSRYENARLAEWHFISPDGTRDIDYTKAQEEFPTLTVLNGYTKDLTLKTIPETLNGWRVYCRFSNDAGSVNTGSALITVLNGQGTPAPAPQSQGFEGRWAEEIAGRCQIVFSYKGEGSVYADISWSSSAAERSRWQMTADVYRDDIMVYDDAHYWYETWSDDRHFTVSDESFGGSGSFYMQDGKLHWHNDQTNEDTVFIPA